MPTVGFEKHDHAACINDMIAVAEASLHSQQAAVHANTPPSSGVFAGRSQGAWRLMMFLNGWSKRGTAHNRRSPTVHWISL